MEPQKKSHSFNVLLTNSEFQDLGLLAIAQNVSRAHVIRELIRRCANMKLRGVPVCVTGKDCYTPHLHQASQAVQPTTNNTIP